METQKLEEGNSKISLLKNDFELFNNAGSISDNFKYSKCGDSKVLLP
jgi:hypothetical protein